MREPNVSFQETPLLDAHRELGARLGPFAGWQMPIQYSGIIAEHEHTRTEASLFDICHMGEFRIRGRAAGGTLDRLLARDVVGQAVGTCRYNFLMTDRGTVQDDLIVYRMEESEFFLVVNAGTREGDAETIRNRLPHDVEFRDESAETAKLDLQGPRSADVLLACGLRAEQLPRYFKWTRLSLLGCDVLLSRTGYTGELGFEIYAPSAGIRGIWDELLRDPHVRPAGLGARNTLRLEVAYPLYGHELDQDTTPFEAGFGELVDMQDREFVGRDGLSAPPRKRLVGFRLDGRRAARDGVTVRTMDGDVCGRVTSGSFAPSLGYAVALGFVAGPEPPAPGTIFMLGDDPARALPGTVAPAPFYTKGTVRSS